MTQLQFPSNWNFGWHDFYLYKLLVDVITRGEYGLIELFMQVLDYLGHI